MPKFTPDTKWDVASALEQLEYCEFECQGGPLHLNVAFMWLKANAARLDHHLASVDEEETHG